MTYQPTDRRDDLSRNNRNDKNPFRRCVTALSYHPVAAWQLCHVIQSVPGVNEIETTPRIYFLQLSTWRSLTLLLLLTPPCQWEIYLSVGQITLVATMRGSFSVCLFRLICWSGDSLLFCLPRLGATISCMRHCLEASWTGDSVGYRGDTWFCVLGGEFGGKGPGFLVCSTRRRLVVNRLWRFT